MLRAALMRPRRRRVQIITLLALVAAPLAAPHAAAADDRDLWATVNVCDTERFPNTIGIRASMPGSRNGELGRYMRFIVKYFSREDERWRRVPAGGDSGWLYVGRGRGPRQFGRSLRIEPMSGEPVLLRGAVLFQWRRGDEVVRRARRRTRRGHRSSAGDDPRGYSAARCTIRG